MKQKNLIIFDMDGVLIDVSMSYRDTVRRTARLFFKGARGGEALPDPLFSLEDLARVKQSGGLNNDWDLTAVILSLLCALVEGLGTPTPPLSWQAFRACVSRCRVIELGRFLKGNALPVSRLLERCGRRLHPFVSACYTGEVGSGNIIKQIFQEIYLGPALFKAAYGISPEVSREKGRIEKETLLMDPAILRHLFPGHILAIATGRPRIEAEYPLDRFGIGHFFSAILTLDDCLKEEKKRFEKKKERISLSKPHPYMLDALQAAFQDRVSGYYYIGDMPDDMLAAKRAAAPFWGIGFLKAAADKDRLRAELLHAGAKTVLDDFESLPALIEAGPF